LDNFTNAAIKQGFVDSVHDSLHEKRALDKQTKDSLFKNIDKKEFLLLEQFARFFSNLVLFDENASEHIEKAAIRLCMSLLLDKKKFDKNFLRRNMLKIHEEDDRLTHLKIFLLKWVENFNDNFSKAFMLHTAPLKSNTRVINLRLGK